MFVGLHAALAMASGIDEIAITQEEGDSFMKAAQNVMRHYSVTGTQKTLDWVAFMGAACAIYIPRLVVLGQKRRQQRQPQPAPVTPFGLVHNDG